MTQEEKARAYDEALEKSKELLDSPRTCFDIVQLKDIFPQLRESEDERIRRTLVEYFGPKVQLDFVRGVPIQKIRDWLEKQKEQKEELVYRLNGLMQDYIKEGKDDEEKEHRFKCYQLFWNALEDANFFEQKEPEKYTETRWENDTLVVDCSKQKPANNHLEWRNIVYYVLKEWLGIGQYMDMAPFNDIVKTLQERYSLPKPAEWSEEDKKMLPSIVNAFRNGTVSTIGQEQWLKSLPERFNLQPKQEWSKEDEKIISEACCSIEEYAKSIKKLHSTKALELFRLCEKLKDLRPCPSWKPSEQEKGALRTAVHVLTEERNFPKAAAQLQNILDAFEGKESRKYFKPNKEQMEALKWLVEYVSPSEKYIVIVKNLYEQLKKL